MEELSQAEVIYPNVASPSLSSGLAGKLQALVLIGRYLGKDTVDELIRRMSEVLLKCEFSHEELDVYNGLAGLLRVLCQYEELFTQPGIPKLCEQIADIIAGSRKLSYEDLHVWKTSHTAWPVSGAGHGQSGVSAALYSAGKRLNRDDFCQLAADGLRFERRIYSESLSAWPDLRKARRSTNYMTGYCSGAPGIGLNALHAGYEHADWMIEHAIESVREEPLQYKDYLCCGNSAAVEFLLEAGRIMNRPDLVQEANARMTMVIARAENDGHYHCVSRSLTNVYSPSLFYGTAGIGYEILRLAYPDRFEPVLL
jgi:lantibiotic modifying enzyme